MLNHECLDLNDTIVAEATPRGAGAIAIVRLSGNRAIEIVLRLMRSTRTTLDTHKAIISKLWSVEQTILDEALVLPMLGPHSYTGEHSVELQLHGSPWIVRQIIKACLAQNARLAEPGEYTLRSFINGRCDLSQAEAVGALIASENHTQHQIALQQLKGGVSSAILELLDELQIVVAAWRARLDFPDDVAEHVDTTPTEWQRLQSIRHRLDHLLQNARTDLFQKQRAVLCGAPNVGKSCFLNAMVGAERVLVDDSPGTTRDLVQIDLPTDGAEWTVVDSAGLHECAEGVEARGIAFTRRALDSADVALWIIDMDHPVWPVDCGIDLSSLIVLGAKSDTVNAVQRIEFQELCLRKGHNFLGWISGKTGEGVSMVRRWLAHGGDENVVDWGQILVVQQRHEDCLKKAQKQLNDLLGDSQRSLDIMTFALEEIQRQFGAVVGRDVEREVLDKIFQDFCIGK